MSHKDIWPSHENVISCEHSTTQFLCNTTRTPRINAINKQTNNEYEILRRNVHFHCVYYAQFYFEMSVWHFCFHFSISWMINWKRCYRCVNCTIEHRNRNYIEWKWSVLSQTLQEICWIVVHEWMNGFILCIVYCETRVEFCRHKIYLCTHCTGYAHSCARVIFHCLSPNIFHVNKSRWFTKIQLLAPKTVCDSLTFRPVSKTWVKLKMPKFEAMFVYNAIAFYSSSKEYGVSIQLFIFIRMLWLTRMVNNHFLLPRQNAMQTELIEMPSRSQNRATTIK